MTAAREVLVDFIECRVDALLDWRHIHNTPPVKMLVRTAVPTARIICRHDTLLLSAGLRIGSLRENRVPGRRWNSGVQAASALPSKSERTEHQENQQKADPSHAGQLAKLIGDSIKVSSSCSSPHRYFRNIGSSRFSRLISLDLACHRSRDRSQLLDTCNSV